MSPQDNPNGSLVGPAQGGVSVVVPSYNHQGFVQTTLRSIFNQTLSPQELLVIDDGSNDNSPKIIRDALRECPVPFEFIARSNRGLCATLNEGLAKTSGKFFAYLSSDDVWLPEFLEARVSTLEAKPQAVLAFGHCYLINSQNEIIDSTRDWANYASDDPRAMLLKQTFAPMSPTVVYRRAAVEKEGWDEQAKLEDYDLYLRLSTEGDFAFDPRVLSAWRYHGLNTSGDFSWMIEARLAAQRRVASRIGLSPNELAQYQRVLTFAGAEDLCRLGKKAEAIRLFRTGLRGAPSMLARMRLVARLLEPGVMLKWRRKHKQKQATERYGALII